MSAAFRPQSPEEFESYERVQSWREPAPAPAPQEAQVIPLHRLRREDYVAARAAPAARGDEDHVEISDRMVVILGGFVCALAGAVTGAWLHI